MYRLTRWEARDFDIEVPPLPYLQQLRRHGGGDDRRVLVFNAREPDGADEGADRVFRNPDLPEALLEPRPLGGAADEAHIGKAPPQRRRRDRHVERVVVGHDEDEGGGAGLGDLGLRIAHAHRLRVRRDVGGKSILPVIEPAHRKRQRRKRQNEGTTHMARTEDQNGRADLAMGLAPAGPAVVAHGGGEIPLHPPLLHAALDLEQPACGLCLHERRDILQIPVVEGLDQDLHTPAAALAEIGPERLIDDPRRSAPGGQHLAGDVEHAELELPAADGAVKGAVGAHDHMRAPPPGGRSLSRHAR